jgi:hypothetical protein
VSASVGVAGGITQATSRPALRNHITFVASTPYSPQSRRRFPQKRPGGSSQKRTLKKALSVRPMRRMSFSTISLGVAVGVTLDLALVGRDGGLKKLIASIAEAHSHSSASRRTAGRSPFPPGTRRAAATTTSTT